MAKTIRKANHLMIEYIKYKIFGTIFYVITLVTLIGLFVYKPYVPEIIFVASAVLGYFSMKKARILKIGWKGEEKSLKVYSKLPDNYIVMSDLYVNVNGETSQIDNIIIGSNGVFVIETKNINGIIQGNESTNKIVQHKSRKGGVSYSKEHYNPIKQVSTHVYRVSKLLKQHKINVWVQGIVYFVNEEAEVMLHSNEVPVFSSRNNGEKKVIDYIANYRNRSGSLGKEEIQKIVNIIRN